MKRTIMFIMALLMLVPCAVADSQKAYEKAAEKQVKVKLKEWKKANWEIFGSANTLEVALRKHYLDLQKDETATELSGVANNFKSKNLGRQAAYNNACVTYAQSEGSDLQARMAEDGFLSTNDPDAEFEHFYAAYERSLQREIGNEMKESFSIIRPYGAGTYEMMTFFVVSDKGASNARKRALKNAIEESNLAEQHARKISDYISGK